MNKDILLGGLYGICYGCLAAVITGAPFTLTTLVLLVIAAFGGAFTAHVVYTWR